MAWSIPDWDGVYGFGTPSKFRIGMFELCRAVNERQIAIGYPSGNRSTFYKADGTLSATITMDDLEGMRITGANSLVKLNMQRIRSAVTSMVPLFTESSGISDTWLTASMEAAMGHPVPDNPTRINDYDYWQGMQDMLDLMTHAYAEHRDDVFLGPTYDGTRSDLESSVANAWTNRADISATGVSGTGDPVEWVMLFTFPSTYEARVIYSETQTYNYQQVRSGAFITEVTGVLAGATYSYTTTVSNVNSITVPFTVDGESDSFSTAAPTSGTVVITSPSITSNYSITRTMSASGVSNPFTGNSGWIRQHQRASPISLYYDITAELTDQA